MANKKAKSKTSQKKKITRSVAPGRSAGKSATPVQKRKDAHPNLDTAFASAVASQGTLLPGQCDNIASDCVRRITQSGRAYNRNDTLQQYGVNSNQQCRAIVDLIIGDKDIGVGRYQFKIVDTSKISGLAASWTMGQLANTIQSSAIPV